MTREEARKLLGGYATGTLTPSEREALLNAALDDQDLFDELAREQSLKELLDSPGAKTRLSAALAPKPAKRWYESVMPWGVIGTVTAGIFLAFFLTRPPRATEVAMTQQSAPGIASVGVNPAPPAVTPRTEPPKAASSAASAQFSGGPFTTQAPKPVIEQGERRAFEAKKLQPAGGVQEAVNQGELKAQADKEEPLGKDAAPAIVPAPGPSPTLPAGIGGVSPAPPPQTAQQAGQQAASQAVATAGALAFRSDSIAPQSSVQGIAAKAAAPRPGIPAFDYVFNGNSLTVRPLTAGYLTVYAPTETETRMLFPSARVEAGSSQVIQLPEGFKTINVDLGTGQSFTNGFLAGGGGGGRKQPSRAATDSNTPTSGRVQASQSSATAHLTFTRE